MVFKLSFPRLRKSSFGVLLGVFLSLLISQTSFGIGIVKNDTAFVTAKLNQAENLLNQRNYNPDHVLDILVGVNELISKKEMTSFQPRLNLLFGDLFSKSNSIDKALENYFNALEWSTKNSVSKTGLVGDCSIEVAKILSRIAGCYYDLKDYNRTMEYFNKALSCLDNLPVQTHESKEKRITMLVNIGSTYLSKEAFDKALIYFNKARDENDLYGSKTILAAILNNLGIVYAATERYSLAEKYYNQSLQIRTSFKDTVGIAQVYNNLGDYFIKIKNYRQAAYYLEEAYNLSIKSHMLSSQLIATGLLSDVYEIEGDVNKALHFFKKYKALHDSIVSSEQIKNVTKLELEHHYAALEKDLQNQKILAVEAQQKKTFAILVIALVLLFSFLMVWQRYRHQKVRIKQTVLENEGLELKSEKLSLENKNLEMELEFRNKELATHVMYLVNKNEFIGTVSQQLAELGKQSDAATKKSLLDIIRTMRSNIDKTIWNEFEVRFQNVHQDFYKKLSDLYPDLTPNEIKLCAFLRLNMSSKDISAITFQSPKSIMVARTRLRKKMSLDRDENLVATLQQL